MRIKFLGTHNCESKDSRMSSFLVDSKFVFDAGGLTSGLSFKEQTGVRAVFLTHPHYDHIRDIPAFGMNLFLNRSQSIICGSRAVYETLITHLLNENLYPNWFTRPLDNPTFSFVEFATHQSQQFDDYSIMALPVNHPVPANGYYVSRGDKSFLYTGDTGTGLMDIWQSISPPVLITELTAPNRYEESIGKGAKHLTPRLLQMELENYRQINGFIPRVVLLHMNPMSEDEIGQEVTAVAANLSAEITLAHEGLEIDI